MNNDTKPGGVKTKEGKAISKFNATKHGILRSSITDYEQEFYSNILEDLNRDYQPIGIKEQILVERLALSYLKLYRVQKAETEYIKSILNPAFTEMELPIWGTANEDGYKPRVTFENIDILLRIYSRYETTVENRLFRIIHELERAQKLRNGENVVQTLAVDVNKLSSFGEKEENE